MKNAMKNWQFATMISYQNLPFTLNVNNISSIKAEAFVSQFTTIFSFLVQNASLPSMIYKNTFIINIFNSNKRYENQNVKTL